MAFSVIHLPENVGGNPQGLSRQLNSLGINSQTWVFSESKFKYDCDKVLFSGSESFFIRELKRFAALRYIFQCDLAFFNFGSGLYNPYLCIDLEKHSFLLRFFGLVFIRFQHFMARFEVSMLNFFKKPIFIQYQGDDARQGDYCQDNFKITFANRVDKNYYGKVRDQLKRKSIRFYGKRSAKIYSLNPDLHHVLPKNTEFLPYSHIDLNEWLPKYNQSDNRPLRIGHAPTNRDVKGTDLILLAVEELKKNGYKFDFVLIENLSNTDAKREYMKLDIFIDQLFAGWYGGVAVEAMALGKPVLAYLRDKDLKFIPSQMRKDLPIINVEPDSIKHVLEELLNTSRAKLLEKARLSRQYVEKWHDANKIAIGIMSEIQAILKQK